jgi:hypothetical protein
MAFAGLKGTLTQAVTSQTNPAAATGSVSVSVGDLIVAVFGENTSLTVGTVTDNLGNAYTAQDAGTDAGAATGRAYLSVVSVAGTLTAVNAVATASANDASAVAAVFEGPFDTSSLDASPAAISNDLASPYACPSTGTLVTAEELVIGWMVFTLVRNITATSPNTMAASAQSAAVGASGSVVTSLGYQLVAATTAVAPAFTASAGPTSTVLGAMSFKRAASTATGNMFLVF